MTLWLCGPRPEDCQCTASRTESTPNSPAAGLGGFTAVILYKALRRHGGASAFGVFLTTRSGFSEHVQTHQTFGGRRAKWHYLCGKDGTTSPYTAGRIASGARQFRPTAHNPGR